MMTNQEDKTNNEHDQLKHSAVLRNMQAAIQLLGPAEIRYCETHAGAGLYVPNKESVRLQDKAHAAKTNCCSRKKTDFGCFLLPEIRDFYKTPLGQNKCPGSAYLVCEMLSKALNRAVPPNVRFAEEKQKPYRSLAAMAKTTFRIPQAHIKKQDFAKDIGWFFENQKNNFQHIHLLIDDYGRGKVVEKLPYLIDKCREHVAVRQNSAVMNIWLKWLCKKPRGGWQLLKDELHAKDWKKLNKCEKTVQWRRDSAIYSIGFGKNGKSIVAQIPKPEEWADSWLGRTNPKFVTSY